MRLRTANVLIVAFMIIALSSCRMELTSLHDDDVVAKVGSMMLYRSEVTRLIPDGTPSEDSLRLALQYINTWASDMVFLEVAEEQLSKNDKDVSKELEAYRRSLLKYRYEQLFVNERLDTSVTEDQIEKYYTAHSEEFTLERPIVKARYMKISPELPDVERLKKLMSSSDEEDIWEVENLAYSIANQYLSYEDKWIDIAVLARDLGVDYASLFNVRAGEYVENIDGYGKLNVAYISDVVRGGAVPPVEFCVPRITDIIISTRKHRLTTSLEQDLLEDARGKGKFVIY